MKTNAGIIAKGFHRMMGKNESPRLWSENQRRNHCEVIPKKNESPRLGSENQRRNHCEFTKSALDLWKMNADGYAALDLWKMNRFVTF